MYSTELFCTLLHSFAMHCTALWQLGSMKSALFTVLPVLNLVPCTLPSCRDCTARHSPASLRD